MRKLRSYSVLGAVTALVLASAPAAFAGTAAAYNYGNCISNGTVSRKLNVYTEIHATDYGRTVKVNPGTLAQAVVKSCDGNNEFAINKTVKLTVTAYGWGISCGAGFPASVSCSGSGSQKVITFDTLSGANPVFLTRTVSSAESIYFDDGAVGDTTKVCATVHGVLWGQGTSATACTTSGI